MGNKECDCVIGFMTVNCTQVIFYTMSRLEELYIDFRDINYFTRFSYCPLCGNKIDQESICLI